VPRGTDHGTADTADDQADDGAGPATAAGLAGTAGTAGTAGDRTGDRDEAFGEYVAGRAEAMRATAYLLCGDWHHAEDIVQTAFTKLYLAWNRVARHDVLDAYVRRIVARTYLDEQRRGWRRERVTATVPEPAAAPAGSPEDRIVLLRALTGVPPRQRAVLVLRYWEDLDVEATARALGCSSGTVKSQANRGLQTLRALLEPAASAPRDGAQRRVLDG
jgi:RNA polymerase sigma-70 factor (sigma-E family)